MSKDEYEPLSLKQRALAVALGFGLTALLVGAILFGVSYPYCGQ